MSGPRIWDQSPTLPRIGVEALAAASVGHDDFPSPKRRFRGKDRPPDETRGRFPTL